MKCILRFLIGIVTVLLPLATALAQTKRGDLEFSLAASFTASKAENTNEYWTALNVPVRLGFLVTNAIEIEPELLLSKFKEVDAGYVLSCNLAYNFGQMNSASQTIQFLFAGLGFSNTIQALPNIAFYGRVSDNWTVLNLGGGLKMFMPKPVALRLEYRFQNYFGDDSVTNHYLLLGVSVFL